MSTPVRPLVLFVAAAGAKLGFGHLVRCGILADALGVRRELVLRGSAASLETALRLGWSVHRGRRIAECLRPDLILVDDPSPAVARRWTRLARARRIQIATVHDGDSAGSGSDLVIDGSIRLPNRRSLSGSSLHLTGPAHAILDPRIVGLRTTRHRRPGARVLVALGGGTYIRTLGVALAARIAASRPNVEVHLAAGFVASNLPALPARCQWVRATNGLADRLVSATVAVTAGGITLYEACAVAAPTVAMPVVDAQRPAIRAASKAGAVVAAAPRGADVVARAARAVFHLLDHPDEAAAMGRRATRLVDGRGAARVAAAIRALIVSRTSEGASRAA